ncbi:MAG: MetQ/NlpA family ABC transporter substrate-binding protein [Oscillospiraceae bacterium]
MKFTAKRLLATLLTGALLMTFTACSEKETASEKPADETEAQVLKVGASPSPHAEILEFVKPALAEKGIDLQIKIFTDYILPNNALDSGDIDANFFQHKPYLDNFNEKNGTDLSSAAAIHFEPLGIYPGKTATLEEIQDGAVIAVPNDTTNEARALQLLVALGLIEMDKDAGLEATPHDITSNPKNLEIMEIEAAQVPRTLPDVDFGVINGNYALAAEVNETVLETEASDSEGAKQYANIIAVKTGNEDNELIKALIEALETEDVKNFMNEKYGVTVVPVF